MGVAHAAVQCSDPLFYILRCYLSRVLQ